MLRRLLMKRTLASTANISSSSSSSRGIKFDKILIANRGEIACRVIRTAKKLGIRTVAVYSEIDKTSMHVDMADEAYCIGKAPSSESYLRMDRIINVAKQSGAQAIHPGYGFLSENPEFAEAVEREGLKFIGPPASAIIAMGSKSASKDIMHKAGVPVVPGYHGTNQQVQHLKEEAEKIGYPVLIKAVKGGGGKGMRIVETRDDFEMMLESSKREAKKSFGDDRVLVEKYLTTPRHVEVQIFADEHKNCVYLFERDCSVQRRHQKIIEEAPAPHLSEDKRRELGDKAGIIDCLVKVYSVVAAAKAVGYVGAGTVEFIMDNKSKEFYFMEMNTRLQVEHPVTEMITGTDLVEWQLQVASGNRLPMKQSELSINGWSFETRIYAEDPYNNFLPSTGKLLHLKQPSITSDDVRVETGIRQNDSVSVYYDPMIAKLVVWGSNRQEALNKMYSKLSEYELVGVETNIEFLKQLCRHDEFKRGNVETGFISKHKQELLSKVKLNTELNSVLAVMLLLQSSSSDLNRFRLNHSNSQLINLYHDQELIQIKCISNNNNNNNTITTTINNNTTNNIIINDKIQVGNKCIRAELIVDDSELTLINKSFNQQQTFHMPTLINNNDNNNSQESINEIKSPMPCKISSINVRPGDAVKKGQVLLVLEAMKMEHVIRAPNDCIIESIKLEPDQLVSDNQLLIKFKQQ